MKYMKNAKTLKLIKHSEAENIEWKPSLSQINEIIEAVSAFSNAKGGKIFVGVNNSGRVLGINIGKDTTEKPFSPCHNWTVI